ncbi:MAG: hypothetical protein K2L62_06340 [Muribaculaceae bacterium]|nr:hypothetical protein [Muribaculaceae bacterium]MDE6628296.1 hypothetical protein [Muribaculaceae bacterium]
MKKVSILLLSLICMRFWACGGEFEIHASKPVINGKYTNAVANSFERQLGTILTFGYDKYKRGDEAPIEIVDNTQKKIRARSNEYIPMLELGKEWRYTVHDCRIFTATKQADYELKYRVDGITKIDGKEYFIINEYDYCPWRGDRVQPYCYMREDLGKKTVYVRNHPEFSGHIGFMFDTMVGYQDEELTLYNFSDYDSQEMYRRSIYDDGNMVYAEIEANDGIHHGYKSTHYEQFGCFEGIGLIKRPERVESMWYGDICDLTGFYPMAAGGGEISPFLYAVVAPDGTEIFSCDKHRPGAGIEAVNADNGEADDVEYYSLQGIRIENPVSGTVCIRRQGASVTKVVIR